MNRLVLLNVIIILLLTPIQSIGQDEQKVLPLEEIVEIWSAKEDIHLKKLAALKEGFLYEGVIEFGETFEGKEKNKKIARIASKRWVSPRGGHPICYEFNFKTKDLAKAAAAEGSKSVKIRGRFTGFEYISSQYLDICSVHIAVFEDTEIINYFK